MRGQFFPVFASILLNRIAPMLLIPAYIILVPTDYQQKLHDSLNRFVGLVGEQVTKSLTNNAQNSQNNSPLQQSKTGDEVTSFFDKVIVGLANKVSPTGSTSSAQPTVTKSTASTAKNNQTNAQQIDDYLRQFSWAFDQSVEIPDGKFVKLNRHGSCLIDNPNANGIPVFKSTCPSEILREVAKQR
jgi:hypothetical protein